MIRTTDCHPAQGMRNAGLLKTPPDTGRQLGFDSLAMQKSRSDDSSQNFQGFISGEIVDAMLENFAKTSDRPGSRPMADPELMASHDTTFNHPSSDPVDVRRCHWPASAGSIDGAGLDMRAAKGSRQPPSFTPDEIAMRDAVLSDRAYLRSASDTIKLPEGVTELQPDELPQSLARLLETDSGYAASLFIDRTLDRVVIANRGTESFIDPDGVADFRQTIGLHTTQYEDAIKLAKEVQRQLGNHYTITTTGHSLGGGLASVQALTLGTTANTFNSAGVHPDTLQRHHIRPENAERSITAYYVEGELLSRLQDAHLPDLAAGIGASLPKLFMEIIDEIKDPAGHDFNLGLAYVPEALGHRIELPAVAIENKAGEITYGKELGVFQRTQQTLSLHGIRSLIGSLQSEIDSGH